MTIDPQAIQALFARAIEIVDRADREKFLTEQCGSDAKLHERIANLLIAFDGSKGFLDQPTQAHSAPHMDATNRYQPGNTIAGRYKLLEAIGEGGMGTVWVAEQSQPVRRKVALKLVKPGMDSKQVLARFDAERQALALMDHPNIAKVFDGGMTDHEHPFFAMEYVKGMPLTEYCDQVRLSLEGRLKLFVPICQAVQHAHQKGIIHRDLKPSNVLVCLYDGKPVPKVIDFGLAKAMHQPLTEHTLHTGHGLILGTPLYMSPEQAEHNNLDVDTRSDIYSLGVILYELLTGTTPLERAQFKEAAFGEILRLIKEVEPRKPSTRVSTNAQRASIAAQRSIEPDQLGRSIRGDLDWIVMKALEKDRTRRYETATSFAADVRRFLAEEAIEARPPSALYRFQKMARRNRVAIATATLVAASLLFGLVGTTWQAIRASQSEKIALENEKKAIEERDAKKMALEKEAEQRSIAEVARDRAIAAEGEAKANEQIATEERNRALAAQAESKVFSDFLVNRFLAASRPSGQDGGVGVDLKMSEAIKKAENHIDGDFVGQPMAESVARHAIGLSYYYRSDMNTALMHLERALELAEQSRGDADAKTLEIMYDKGLVLGQLLQHTDAMELFTSVVEGYTKLNGPNHADTLAASMNLAETYRKIGNLDKSIELHRVTYQRLKSSCGDDDKNTLFSASLMARTYLELGGVSVSTALDLLEDAVKRAEAKYSVDNPTSMYFKTELATGYLKSGQGERAVEILEDLLPRSRRVRGAEHGATLSIQNKLINCLFAVGRTKDAMQILDQEYREVLAVTKNHDALPSRIVHAKVVRECEAVGYYEGIVDFYGKILADLRKHLPAEHLGFASWMDIIGYNLLRQGKWNEAADVTLECHKIRLKARPTSWDTYKTESMLGAARLGQKKYAEAEMLLINGYEGMVREEKSRPKLLTGQLPKRSRHYYADAVDRLIELYRETNNPDELGKWQAERGKYPAISLPTSDSSEVKR